MATILTTRLNLAKQDKGDEPGIWHSTQNDGYDDADERFFLSGAGEPDGNVESHFVGQRYLDSETELWWTSTSVGDPANFTADLAVLDAAITHPDPATSLPGDYPYGHLQARLEWVSATEVKLSPITPDGIIHYDNEGIRVNWTGDLTFDITTDLEGAQVEAATTAYYLYMDYLTGPSEEDPEAEPDPIPARLEPDPVISETPPNSVGYHPTLADHRCVGSIWNNSSEDITKFLMVGNRMVFNEVTRDPDHHYNLNATGQSALRVMPLNIPLTCEAAQLLLFMFAPGATSYAVFAHAGKSINLVDAGGLPHTLNNWPQVEIVLQQGLGRGEMTTWDMPVVDMADPKMLYGHNDANNPDELEALVHGYTDIYAPRGY